MRHNRKKLTFTALIALVALLVIPLLYPAAAASREARRFRWEYIHVDVEVQADGSAIITEEQQISFQGPYSFVNRVIPLNKLRGITDVAVGDENGWYAEGIDPNYRPVSYAGYVPKGQPGRYTVERHNGEVTVTWFFAALNETRTFRLRYRVTGVVRTRGDYDEIWWAAIGPDRGAEVAQASATIRLPERAPVSQLVATAYEDESQVRAGAVANEYGATYDYGRVIPEDESWTVRLLFPRGIAAAVPPIPFRNYAAPILISIALAIVATASFLRQLLASLARPEPLSREYTSPPAEIPPGLIAYLFSPLGSLAGPATFLDLAERGYVTVSRVQIGQGWSRRTQYEIEDTGRDRSDLLPYERALLEVLIEGTPFTNVQLQTTLNNINRDRQLSEEADRRGWFVAEQRRRMSAAPIILRALAAMLACIALSLWVAFSGPEWLVAITVLSGSMMVVFQIVEPMLIISRRTESGARTRQQWASFFRTLRRPNAIIEQTPGNALRWLPYAVAANVTFYWDRALRHSQLPAPAWYHSEVDGVPLTDLLMSDFVHEFIWVGSFSSGTGGGGGVGGASGGGGGTAG